QVRLSRSDTFSQEPIAPNHQECDELDGTRAEPRCVGGRPPLVVEPEDPVDDLAEAVLEAMRPVGRGPGRLLEDAGGRRVLELDEAVLMTLRIADDEVGLVVTEDVELEGDPIWVDDVGVPGPDQRGEMSVTPEEGQDVLSLTEGAVGMGVEQLLELGRFLSRDLPAEGEVVERRHSASSRGTRRRARVEEPPS